MEGGERIEEKEGKWQGNGGRKREGEDRVEGGGNKKAKELIRLMYPMSSSPGLLVH